MNMTTFVLRLKVGQSDLYFIDFVFLYTSRNGAGRGYPAVVNSTEPKALGELIGQAVVHCYLLSINTFKQHLL